MTSARCAVCKRTRPVTFSVSRRGGGNYRTAQRSYRSTVCSECVLGALAYVHTSNSSDGIDSRTIVDLAKRLLADDPTLTATEWVRDDQAARWSPPVAKTMPVAYFIERYEAQRESERAAREARRAAAGGTDQT